MKPLARAIVEAARNTTIRNTDDLYRIVNRDDVANDHYVKDVEHRLLFVDGSKLFVAYKSDEAELHEGTRVPTYVLWKENCPTGRPRTWELQKGECIVGRITQQWANCFYTHYLPTTETNQSETLEGAKELLLSTFLQYHGIAREHCKEFPATVV